MMENGMFSFLLLDSNEEDRDEVMSYEESELVDSDTSEIFDENTIYTEDEASSLLDSSESTYAFDVDQSDNEEELERAGMDVSFSDDEHTCIRFTDRIISFLQYEIVQDLLKSFKKLRLESNSKTNEIDNKNKERFCCACEAIQNSKSTLNNDIKEKLKLKLKVSKKHDNKLENEKSIKENEKEQFKSWQDAWNQLSEHLDQFDGDNYINECLQIIINTSVLEFYLQNKFNLDLACINSIFYSDDPKTIQLMFDEGLINEELTSHIDCLLEKKYLFNALNRLDSLRIDEKSYCIVYSIMSLAVLIYKIKCSKKLNSILRSISVDLAKYINKAKVNRYISIAIKFLFKSLILNAVCTNENISQFLLRTCNKVPFLNLDSKKFHQVLRLKLNAQSIPLEFQNLFPMSLKNMSRIAIKNSINHYNKPNIQKLPLPNILKQFLNFDDEMNLIDEQMCKFYD